MIYSADHLLIFDTHAKGPSKTTYVSMSESELTFNGTVIPRSLIVGFAHAEPNTNAPSAGLCIDSALKQISNSVSVVPTGFWIVVCYTSVESPVLRLIKFKSNQGDEPVSILVTSLNRKDRILFVLNPFGGTKHSLTLFNDLVVPFMAIARLEYTLIKTSREKHATEIASTLNLELYETLICISGDGIFHEVVDGLLYYFK